ncbi:LOW QUALITY PROTEIN: cell adhesion molecule Dscam2-like [Macrobrachium rosenbergii]|uniref:LOW QUALITY PROTEIN: cell adhesion molecule Dscam2-like n=1 Tax=Macrobrachium rosenbergii TaxID=79674 RepID=UPI0034D511C9
MDRYSKANYHPKLSKMFEKIRITVLLHLLVTASLTGGSSGDAGGPRLTVTPPSHVVFSSETGVVVGCVAEGSPPPTVTWVTREGRPLPNYSPFIDILANGSLVLRPFQPDRYRADVHAATVRCRASNTHGTVISPPVTLQAVVWQEFIIRAEGGRAIIGGSVLLKCLIPAHLSKVVTPTAWEMSTHTIYPTSTPEGRYLMVGTTGDLLVRGVTHEDAFSEFKCRVRDRVNGGREMSSREPAKILVLEHGEPSRPSIVDQQRSVTVPEGAPLVLPCIATGSPTPTVNWINYMGTGLRTGIGGHALGHLNNQHLGPAIGSDVLVIESAQTSDSRSYTCAANNSVGADQVTVDVVVEPRLTVSVTPAKVKIDLGGTATFSCRVSDPAAAVTWFYNGSPINGNGRIVAAGGQLIISSVTRDDPGMYQCQASRSTRAAQQASQLILADSKPVLQYRFIEQTIQPGPSVSLRCSAVANPMPTITWTLDGLPIPQSDRVVVGVQEGSRGEAVGHVNISHTRVEDGGRYQCTASNVAGTVYHRASLNIYGLPVGRPLATVTAVSGQMLELRCPVTGYPLHTFTWNKDGEGIVESLGRRIDTDGTLILERVSRPSDAGVYTCTASTKQGRAATGSAQVSVLVPPRIESFSFTEDLSEGMRTQVMCGVSQGDPPINIEWLKDGHPFPKDGPPNIQVMSLDGFSSVLAISSLTAGHSGRYTCQVRNSAAIERYTATLTVNVPPTWVLEPRDSHVIRGQSLVVDCAARGYPEPSLIWKKKVGSGSDAFRSVELVRPRAEQLSNGSLYIAGAEPEHAGTYVCHSSNSVNQISSTINISVNSAPYFLGGTSSEEIRAGEMAVLECRVKGDAPLTLNWAFRGAPLHHTSRYIENEKVDPEGILVGKIEILSASQADAGDYTCTAQNDFGRNSRIITLSVHEPPSPPRGLQVIWRGSRSVRISWAVPEPSPSSYILQYREATEGWSESRELTIQGGFTPSGGVEISPLIPAASYIVRVSAVNHLGRSAASEELRFTTSPEKPGAAPVDVRAEATGPREVKVSWRPPPKYRAHGTILGFYLGYAPVLTHTSSTGTPQYNFTTVERSQGLRTVEEGLRSDGEVIRAGTDTARVIGAPSGLGGSVGPTTESLWVVKIGGLQPYTKYHVVVQAFNSEGSGPLSSPVAVTTREDVPGGPPLDCRCNSLSWDSVQVSWGAPDPRLHHGILKGYRFEYERWDGWSDTVQTSQTTSLTAVVTGLEAATNYSVRVRAFNSAGDGPWSLSIVCTTHEDVPGRVAAIKVVVASPYSFIVSWSPPTKPNGYIVSYKVTWRVVSARLGGGRGTEGISTLAGTETFIKVENVQGRLVEVEVVAATREGEGPPTAARVTLTNSVPAAIFSTSVSIKSKRGDDVTLPCGHVGDPQPSLVWTYQNRQVSQEGRMIKSDGGLLIQDVQKQDSGNYTCTVSNSHGSDHLTHHLTVLIPPSAPLVLASSSSESSVQVQWKPGDDGGSPVIRYSLYYRKDHGAWTQMNLHRHANSHTLKGLECGSRYHIYVVSHNAVGVSPSSSTAVVRTLGGLPAPQPQQFFSVNSSSIAIFPKAWRSHGCPISHLVLEYRQYSDKHWIQVSSGWPKENRVDVGGLGPSTRYDLRATAVTSAGSTTHSYSFTTLTATGEVSPVWSEDGWRQWGSLRVLLPLLTSVIALASSLTLVCYCFRRKIIPGGNGKEAAEGERDKRSTSSDVMDNKHNMAQREQYYATIKKANHRDNQSDTAPEDADDIYPYATFPSSNQVNPDSSHIPMMPIYQTHNYEKKNETYGESKQNRDSRARGQFISRSRSRSRGGVADSDDYKMLGSETETEYGGVSSRTESSNQLDDIPSIRDQSVYSRDSVYSGDSARTVPVKDPRDAGFPKEREGARNAASQGFQQRIHHNLLYHAESSTSPEPSPTTERKSFLRHARARSRVTAEGVKAVLGGLHVNAAATPPAAMPPSYPGVVGSHLSGRPNRRGPSQDPPEVSEAECDRDILPPPRRYSDAKFKGRNSGDYSIDV